MFDTPLSPHAVELADAVHVLVMSHGKQHFLDRYVQWQGEYKASVEQAKEFDRARHRHFSIVRYDPEWMDNDHPPHEGSLWDDQILRVVDAVEWYDEAGSLVEICCGDNPIFGMVVDLEEVRRKEHTENRTAKLISCRKKSVASYVPPEFYRDRRPCDDLPLPPPQNREVTLPEKYAALIAVHDEVYRDSRICSEPPSGADISSAEDYERLMKELPMVVLRTCVRDVCDDDWKRVGRWLPDIEADLSSPDDLLTTKELAQLADVTKKTLFNKLDLARKKDYQGVRPPKAAVKGVGSLPDEYSYAAIRPWLLATWPHEAMRFPKSIVEVRHNLASPQ